MFDMLLFFVGNPLCLPPSIIWVTTHRREHNAALLFRTLTPAGLLHAFNRPLTNG